MGWGGFVGLWWVFFWGGGVGVVCVFVWWCCGGGGVLGLRLFLLGGFLFQESREKESGFKPCARAEAFVRRNNT